MTHFEQRLELLPVPEPYAAIYRERGMAVPELHSGHSVGALIPLRLRVTHRFWAEVHGYCWQPCVLCGTEFGGHEISDVIPNPFKGEGWSIVICPFCTIERNRGNT